MHDFGLIKRAVQAELELPVNAAAVIHEGHHAIIVQRRLDKLTFGRVLAASVEFDGFSHGSKLRR
jgi:hypothetical protein